MPNSVLVMCEWDLANPTREPFIEGMIASRGSRLVIISKALWTFSRGVFHEYTNEVFAKAKAIKDELSTEFLERIGSCDKADDAIFEIFKLAESALEPGSARAALDRTIFRFPYT